MHRFHLLALLLLSTFAQGARFAPPAQDPNPALRPGKDFALFFAVSDYKEWDDLQNPVKDAEAIAGDLAKYYGFDTLVVRNPTYEKVIEILNRYAGRTYAEDGQLFVFFTGHGDLNNLKEGFFIPRDGKKNDPSQQSYLLHARIADVVNKIPCKHILLGIDACFSGSFMRAIGPKGDIGRRPGETDETIRNRVFDDLLQYKSRLVITSGGEEPTNDNSQFARQILAALRSRGGDAGFIDFYGLVGYLQSARPTPRHGEFGDSAPGGQFLFVYTPPGGGDPDKAAWDSALRQNTPEAFAYYLDLYPQGRFRAQATDERAWLLAARQNTPDAYRMYTDAFPDGRHAREALERARTPDDGMVLIKGGTFQMGDENNGPVHAVTVSDFYLSKYEVTVKEYLAFANETKSHYPEWLESGSKYNINTGSDDYYKKMGTALQDPNYPIVGISWDDAVAYCTWKSKKTGQTWRLPTEAEWEYAAKGGKNDTYAGTSEESQLYRYANYGEAGSSDKDGYEYTSPVGKYLPNAFGLYDMSGNVWEWCGDWYAADYYGKSPSDNPKGPNEGSLRMLRGGSWDYGPQGCRCAIRFFNTPDARLYVFGFRPLRTVSF